MKEFTIYPNGGYEKCSERIGNLKHDLVRYAIYDAAIKLFTLKGFEETAIEEIVLAAGLSRRSFFRYFKSKDDLLALSVVNYSGALSHPFLHVQLL